MTVTSWFYQLQKLDVATVNAIKADVKVIDPTVDGVLLFERDQIASMRGSPKTKLLAYLSIGETEDYRSYWDPKAAYLAEENPEWKGNYKVRYWDPAWWKIILARVKALALLGFDGVYLDIIDAYEYWEERGIPDAANMMKTFVKAIMMEGRTANPDFWIVPQNGEALLEDARYRDMISAIGIEDLAYDGGGEPNGRKAIDAKMAYLNLMVDDHKPVLVVEYPAFHNYQGSIGVAKTHFANGYVPYITTRDLDYPTQPLHL